MNVPKSKLDMIMQEHSSELQRSHTCWEVYLTDHPYPTWKRVAHALYMQGHIEELEVVQKKYLKGG